MKMVKRMFTKAKKAMKKRYVSKGGNLKIGRLVKDVRYLKSVLNPEKKRLQSQISQQILGQVDGNASGWVSVDTTPALTVGSGYNQRNGASVKLHSSHYQFQIKHQPEATGTICYKIQWFLVKGTPFQSADVVDKFSKNVYQPNPFVSNSTFIYDSNSQLNPDYFGTYTLLRTVKGSVKSDQTTGELSIRNFNVGFKYFKGKGHHLRWNQNGEGTANLFDGQLIMVITCDRGNRNTGAPSSLPNVPDQSASTGLVVSYSRMDYFYDN